MSIYPDEAAAFQALETGKSKSAPKAS